MSVILSVTTKELFTFSLCTLHIFGLFAIFRCFSSLWDFVYVYSHIVYSWSSTVSTFFSFLLWTPGMSYLDYSNTVSHCGLQLCDSSCLTGYEPCTLVAPNFSSACCPLKKFSHFTPHPPFASKHSYFRHHVLRTPNPLPSHPGPHWNQLHHLE